MAVYFIYLSRFVPWCDQYFVKAATGEKVEEEGHYKFFFLNRLFSRPTVCCWGPEKSFKTFLPFKQPSQTSQQQVCGSERKATGLQGFFL